MNEDGYKPEKSFRYGWCTSTYILIFAEKITSFPQIILDSYKFCIVALLFYSNKIITHVIGTTS